MKLRAPRFDIGNYSLGYDVMTPKIHIIDVVYNVSNNELVRIQTLVKSAIIQVDSTPFLLWYQQLYVKDIGKMKKAIILKKEIEGEDAGDKDKKKKIILGFWAAFVLYMKI